MDSTTVKSCSTCKHYMTGVTSIDDAPPFCWDCAPSPNKLRWSPNVNANTPIRVPEKNAWNKQVGGSHYTDCAIQPFQYSMANHLDPMQHTAIKYITRFRKKGGIRDLEAAIHTIELLIEWTRTHGNQTESAD